MPHSSHTVDTAETAMDTILDGRHALDALAFGHQAHRGRARMVQRGHQAALRGLCQRGVVLVEHGVHGGFSGVGSVRRVRHGAFSWHHGVGRLPFSAGRFARTICNKRNKRNGSGGGLASGGDVVPHGRGQADVEVIDFELAGDEAREESIALLRQNMGLLL